MLNKRTQVDSDGNFVEDLKLSWFGDTRRQIEQNQNISLPDFRIVDISGGSGSMVFTVMNTRFGYVTGWRRFG